MSDLPGSSSSARGLRVGGCPARTQRPAAASRAGQRVQGHTAGLTGVRLVPLALQWPELSHMTQARGLAPLPGGQPPPSLCSHWTGGRSRWVLAWPQTPPFAECCPGVSSASPQPVLPALSSLTGDSIALEQLGRVMRENRLTPIAAAAPVGPQTLSLLSVPQFPHLVTGTVALTRGRRKDASVTDSKPGLCTCLMTIRCKEDDHNVMSGDKEVGAQRVK